MGVYTVNIYHDHIMEYSPLRRHLGLPPVTPLPRIVFMHPSNILGILRESSTSKQLLLDICHYLFEIAFPTYEPEEKD